MIDLVPQRILITGGAGFLGRHLAEHLRGHGCRNLFSPRHADYDLCDRAAVRRMLGALRPTLILHLAARVGGIGANRDNTGLFFHDNMAMGLHLIEEARRAGVAKFVQLGTVCAYPKFTPVPFSEDALWDGYPEETNAPYGVAKKALLVMLQGYRAQYGFNGVFLLPANLYGPGDNFDLQSSHVIPALIRKFDQAKRDGADHVTLWGDGTPTREFLYVADAARAIALAAQRYDQPEPLNIGTGEEVSIAMLATKIAALVGFSGQIRWDTSKPNGQPRRRLDVTRAQAALGFKAETPLDDGLRRTVAWWQAWRGK